MPCYSKKAKVGFDTLFFGRIDYQDRIKCKNEKSLEVIWQGSRSLGSSAQVSHMNLVQFLFRIYAVGLTCIFMLYLNIFSHAVSFSVFCFLSLSFLHCVWLNSVGFIIVFFNVADFCWCIP